MSSLSVKYLNKLASLVLTENPPTLNFEAFWQRAIDRMEQMGHGNGHHQHVHVHHLFNNPLSIKLESPLDDLLHKKLDTIMATLADLQAAVAAENTVIDSAVALIQGLAQQIADLKPDQAAIDALAADVKGRSDALAAAVQANTPSA